MNICICKIMVFMAARWDTNSANMFMKKKIQRQTQNQWF